MSPQTEKIKRMIGQLDKLINAAREEETTHENLLSGIHPNYQRSARNLLHYQALRQYDIRSLQKRLGFLGLSRLAKSEAHILASLLTIRGILKGFLKPKRLKSKRAGLSIKQGQKLLNKHSKDLLGNRSKGRRPRIMVTMPSEAAHDLQLVEKMVEAGMNIARINCAHDGPEVWSDIIGNLRHASEKFQRKIKIAMDLAGPKIRTGPISAGPQVIRLRTTKNQLGEVIRSARVWLSDQPPEDPSLIHIPVPQTWVNELQVGNRIVFRDARNKKRRIVIVEKSESGCKGECYQNAYILTGMEFRVKQKPEISKIRVGALPALEQSIHLLPGHQLRLHWSPEPGENALRDESGLIIRDAHISCTSHEVFSQAKPGQKIRFDDGKISGVIQSASADEMVVEIVRTSSKGGNLKADKGINFPDSQLSIRGLTKTDKEYLPFVVEHADIVNMSFVNVPDDVEELVDHLQELNALETTGIILKIETRRGFENLMKILLTAMQAPSIGVMIARGDLAVEIGWDRMGMIQEEIQWICQAAHVPDIWATQVLENLAKKGLPSRAEITDVTIAQSAECIMLNKGPYIINAIQLLDTILRHMRGFKEKKAGLTPPAAKKT